MQMGAMLAGAAILLIWAVDAAFAKTIFTPADLAGQWNLHGLISGGPSDLQGWVYGTMTCDNKGQFVRQWMDSAGRTSKLSGTFLIDPDGVITALAGGGLLQTYHGAMNVNKDTFILTGNDAGGGCFLAVGTKSVGTLTASDLRGRWVWHAFVTSRNDCAGYRWCYGSGVFDSNGNGEPDSSVVMNTGSGVGAPVRLSVSSGGIVIGVIGPSDLHGAVNQSKDMGVAVGSLIVCYEGGISGDMLMILEKEGSGYTSSNLAGTWYVHGLVSGSSYVDRTDWYHYTCSVDRRGKASTVGGSYLASGGEAGQTTTAQMSIANEGIVRMPNLPSFHGMMNLSRTLWVATMDDAKGRCALSIAIGRPADEFDFNADGRVDFRDLAVFASHWMN